MKTTLASYLLLLIQLVLLPPAFAQTGEEKAYQWRATLVAQGISHPWGMAWLPDGRLLVTSREGTLHVLNGNRFDPVPLDGMPAPLVSGQGGLLDIALHPADQAPPIRVYMTMSTGTESRNRTTLVRGVFDGSRVDNLVTLFKAKPNKSGSQHFGSRILFLPDNTLLMSVGDGGNPPLVIGDRLAREQAQNLGVHLGKILRLTENGDPAPGNPFIGQAGARPEIWSYGHRNIQGLTRDSEGRVWATEHGPRGGDELNLIRRGKNYGWPIQSYGLDYRTGEPVGQTSVPGVKQPKTYWAPSIAPSGLAFYTGPDFPRWQGSLFGGGMVSQDLRRLGLNANGAVLLERRYSIGARVRDVRQGPDGKLYVLTDEGNGKLYRIDRVQ